MRSRSGAIHSDSAEDFLLMAELTQSKNGIFYDQSTNKKIMNQIQKSNKQKNKQKMRSPKSPSCDTTKQNLFKDFNFNEQTEQTCEELQELGKKVSNYSKVVILGIEAKSISMLKQKIVKQMDLSLDLFEQDRCLDLLLIHKQQLLFKIWLFRQNSTQKYPFLDSYYKRCHILYKQINGKYFLQSIKHQDFLPQIEVYIRFLSQ